MTFGAAFLISTQLAHCIETNFARKTSSLLTRYVFVMSLASYCFIWLILISFVHY
ncbi:MAG: hypothetical protein VSS52_007515 [Thiotrichaceae bacterium]|nr:hypothetical protein [Thiotrichaceae bacterium]